MRLVTCMCTGVSLCRRPSGLHRWLPAFERLEVLSSGAIGTQVDPCAPVALRPSGMLREWSPSLIKSEYTEPLRQLACMFLSSSSLPQALWSLLGVGIRLAQDLGIHRKLVYSGKPNVQEEQWKRVFWYARQSLTSGCVQQRLYQGSRDFRSFPVNGSRSTSCYSE
jgi:hypothetical protein